MKVVTKIRPLRNLLNKLRQDKLTVAFVPTMGSLHDGHLALVRRAKKECDIVVVSIFVNPTQFGPGEDLDEYPRNLANDTKLLEAEKVDVLFTPEPSDMYPSEMRTSVVESDLSSVLCGQFRPGHFTGVATIVTKLFNIVAPDIAIFGKKDYQQFILIKRIAKDLDMDIKVIGVDTVREKDGLAMSSRNAYLSPEARKAAVLIHRTLKEMKAMRRSGIHRASKLISTAKRGLSKDPLIKLQYLEIVDPITLKPATDLSQKEARALIACFVSDVRLIDNVAI